MYKCLKSCKLNVENLTKDQKTFVLQLWPPANVRELTRAQASSAWFKSHKAYKMRELSHEAWLWFNSRRPVGKSRNLRSIKVGLKVGYWIVTWICTMCHRVQIPNRKSTRETSLNKMWKNYRMRIEAKSTDIF